MGVRSRRSKSKRRKAATSDSGGVDLNLISGVAPRAPLPSAGDSCAMGVRSRSNPKRRRRAAATVSGSGGGVDMISGLHDDLLLRILDLVPAAESVVRTHALSRRWRGLWTGVAALRFEFSRWRQGWSSDAAAAAERYIAFINGALALRAAAKEPAFVEDLAIKFDISDKKTGQLVPLAVEAAQGWIDYAVQQHGVRSFILKLMLPWRWELHMPADGDDNDIDGDDNDIDGDFDMPADGDGNDIEHPVMTLDEMGNYAKMETMHLRLRLAGPLDEMGNYAKMETMHLRLAGAELRLPSSKMIFPSLIDLSLEDTKVPDGDDYLLSHLVSSACCPRLHKLRLWMLNFELSAMLLIEDGTLVELSLDTMFGLEFLELRTPSLQVLCIEGCFQLNGFTVSAPRLKDLKFWVQQPLYIDDVPGQLSNVGTLKIQMFSHGGETNFYSNDASLHLLQCCRLARCLEVSFEIPETEDQTVDIIKGRILLLPYVTHLAVDINLWERHSTGPGVSCLLAQCSNIKYLSLELLYIITEKKQSELDLLCDNNSCHWRSHEFLLAHLQEVEFKRLMGTDCEFQFIQSIVTKATGIQKVTISFNRNYWRKGRKHAVKLLPPLDGGLWTICKDAIWSDVVCEWRRENSWEIADVDAC